MNGWNFSINLYLKYPIYPPDIRQHTYSTFTRYTEKQGERGGWQYLPDIRQLQYICVLCQVPNLSKENAEDESYSYTYLPDIQQLRYICVLCQVPNLSKGNVEDDSDSAIVLDSSYSDEHKEIMQIKILYYWFVLLQLLKKSDLIQTT